MFLINKHGNIHQCEIAITQELMEEAYTNRYGLYTTIIRFNNGIFEYLYPHKWRDAKDGGGWDENGLWQEKWEPIHKKTGIK